jgi:hypothetical protein
MGYDFLVSKGRLLPERKVKLLGDLTRFAAGMELEWSALDILFTGTVHYTEFNFSWHPEAAAGDASYALVASRPWKPSTGGIDQLLQLQGYVAPARGERIQGLILHHPYADWAFMWNVSREHTLASYVPACPVQGSGPDWEREAGGRRSGRLTPAEAEALFAGPPLPLTVPLDERNIHLHTPWGRGDVLAALDALRTLQAASENFDVHDDYGVWQNGMAAWKNLGEKWRDTLKGGELVHPDESILLGETPDEPDPLKGDISNES